ncbi:MAG: zinc ribbon domain-containing protein [Acidobacteriota bacterium]
MFCPRCSTENLNEPKYCRKCGLHLTSVHMSLDGRLDEVIEQVRKGEGILGGGAVTLIICVVAALLITLFESGINIGVLFYLVIGLLVAVPMLYVGMKRITGAKKLIEGKARELESNKNIQLTTAPTTDPVLALPAESPSVTEHTTYDLPPVETVSTRQMQSE